MKKTLLLLTSLLLIYYFWESNFIIPLKLLVVFFHESSHALTTILTGGEVVEFVIVKEQGGHVISAGGNRFLILSSGYLGSLLWGVSIYLVSLKTKADKQLMIFIALIIGLIPLIFSSSWFTMGFGLGTFFIMMCIAKFLSRAINEFILQVIGLTNILYVPQDIYSDTISRSHLKSDAFMLAIEYGGPTILWGIAWLLISLTLIFYCVKFSLKDINKDTYESQSNSRISPF